MEEKLDKPKLDGTKIDKGENPTQINPKINKHKNG